MRTDSTPATAHAPPDEVERNVRRLPLVRACLRNLDSLLGITRGQVGLDLGGWGGVVSAALRRRGGVWCSMDAPGPAFDSLHRRCKGEQVYPLDRLPLPFEDQSFDVLVVLDLFGHARDENALVQECHRVLKPAGRLIVQAPFLRAGSLTPALARLAHIEDPWAGRHHTAYTRPHLFSVLKDGFDVQAIRVYGRPFSTLFDHGMRMLAQKRGLETGAIFEAWGQVARTWAPAGWVATLLDMPLLFSRGQRIMVRAKRRLWIPRHTPVLRDGRSIAEATLQTKIGTASHLSQIMAPHERAQIRTRR